MNGFDGSHKGFRLRNLQKGPHNLAKRSRFIASALVGDDAVGADNHVKWELRDTRSLASDKSFFETICRDGNRKSDARLTDKTLYTLFGFVYTQGDDLQFFTFKRTPDQGFNICQLGEANRAEGAKIRKHNDFSFVVL